MTIPEMSGNGSVNIEVNQFGGRFGKDIDGLDIKDDGISHKKEGGLKLNVKYETLENGSSKVFAKIFRLFMFKEITKDNWLLFAQQNYDNPTLEKEEKFYDDIKRFKYLKRLFRKYDITNEIKIRLVLNHLVVLQNVFGVEVLHYWYLRLIRNIGQY